MAGPCIYYIDGHAFSYEDFVSYLKKLDPKKFENMVKECPNCRDKGEVNSSTPPAPFVTNTNAWTKLGMKYALQQAVKSGADVLAWTTGEQQNERYDLSKQVDYIKKSDGGYLGDDVFYLDISTPSSLITLRVDNKTNKGLILEGKNAGSEYTGKNISDVVGKDVAEKIMQSPAGTKLEGEGLKVGGKGMIGFYGSPTEGKSGIVGDVAKALVKELTGKEGKVETTDIRQSKIFETDRSPQPSISITPELRAAVEKGMPQYQDGKGAVETLANGRKVIHALDAPDFSTAVHELAHVFEDDLTDAERKTVSDWAKQPEWNTKSREAFARGWERYLRDGVAPTEALKSIFEKAKQWLTAIYTRVKGTPIEKKISPEVKAIYDRLLGKEQSEAPGREPGQNVTQIATENLETPTEPVRSEPITPATARAAEAEVTTPQTSPTDGTQTEEEGQRLQEVTPPTAEQPGAEQAVPVTPEAVRSKAKEAKTPEVSLKEQKKDLLGQIDDIIKIVRDKNEKSNFNELLTPESIQSLRDNGYIVEQIDEVKFPNKKQPWGKTVPTGNKVWRVTLDVEGDGTFMLNLNTLPESRAIVEKNYPTNPKAPEPKVKLPYGQTITGPRKSVEIDQEQALENYWEAVRAGNPKLAKLFQEQYGVPEGMKMPPLPSKSEAVRAADEVTAPPAPEQTGINKAIDFLDGLKIDTKNKAFDATLGLPIAVWNSSIDVIKLSLKAGKKLAEAIDDAVKHIKSLGHTFDEAEFTTKIQDTYGKAEAKLRAEVTAGLADRYGNIEEKIFGNRTKTDATVIPKRTIATRVLGSLGRVQEATFGRAYDKGSDLVAKLASKAIESQNGLIRNAAKVFESLVKNIARQDKEVARAEQFGGSARERSAADANRINRFLTQALGGDKQALHRINQALDPDFYRERSKDEFIADMTADLGTDAMNRMTPAKIDDEYEAYREAMGFDKPEYTAPATYADLTPNEKAAADLIREIYDYVHDLSFSIGKIPLDTYVKKKGTYTARLYDEFEFPQEINEIWQQASAKMQTSGYKHRDETISSWKARHRIENPIHAVTKRLYQAKFNKAVFDYADWIMANRPEWVSRIEKKGYTLLGNGYGALSNKYVLDTVAEDFKGIFYTDKVLSAMYKAVTAYDRLAPRRFYRGLFTVWNPAVQVGNHTGNIVFAAWNGISPIRFEKNFWTFARNEVRDHGSTYRYLLDKGLLKSALTRGDLMDSFMELQKIWDEAADSPNPLKTLRDAPKKWYEANDDMAKIAAFKSLIDMGITPQAALKRVADGYQNYRRVGRAYDFASKVPVIGNMFARWGGDLGRILKSGIATRPLQLAAFGATIHALAYMASKLSGESEEEREIRENRIGYPSVPMPKVLGGNIPLAIKVGDNELNLARYISPLFIYSTGEDDNVQQIANKFLPFQYESVDYTTNPGGTQAVEIAKISKDPMLAPLVQVLVNSDWKGSPILDPSETIYQKGGLPKEYRFANAMRFLARSYVPYGAYGDDFVRALIEGKDYYGRTKTPGQVLLRFVGWNSQQFKQDRYYKAVTDEVNVLSRRLDNVFNDYNSVMKQRKEGKLTPEQFQKRTAEMWEQSALIIQKTNDAIHRQSKYLSPKSYDELIKLEQEYQANKPK